MSGVYRRAPMGADMTADDPVTLAAAWPLFALRIRTERLVLRLPTDDDPVQACLAMFGAGPEAPGS